MNSLLDKYGREILVGLLLAGAVWGVFGQTVRFGFVNYDDGYYVYNMPAVSEGLALTGMARAFTSRHADGWYPLTTLSLMLDATLYGNGPGGFHFTSVLLHAAGSIVLFLALQSLTGSLWRSAFVAAVFAIHPLRAESVAWVSERKDVLSGLFFFLTLWAYAGYARGAFSWRRYLPVIFLFVCGLISKAMTVTLPFVLLVLDFWPLRRFATGVRDQESEVRNQQSSISTRHSAVGNWKLLIEKVPFFALSAAVCVITLIAEERARPSVDLPAVLRLKNAAVSYIVYIVQTVFPEKLAVGYFYPPGGPPLWKAAGAILLLILLSAAAVLSRRKHPYLLTGWLWYLGMLVPVIGIVQVGAQPHADRYTYLPQTGLCIAAVWVLAGLPAVRRYRRVSALAAAGVLAALTAAAHVQTRVWRDSRTLWTHALNCSENNALACNNLAWMLATASENWLRNGAEAVKLAEKACKLTGYSHAGMVDTLAAAYAEAGRFDEAVQTAERAAERARARGSEEQAQKIEARLELYRQGIPFRQ